MMREINATGTFNTDTANKTPSERHGKGLDFPALLQAKMEGFQPLERIIIDMISRTLDSLLAQGDSKSGFPFLASPLFIPSKESIVEPARDLLSEIDLPAEPSENLQEKQDFDPIVEAAGKKYGVDSSLIRAVIQTESSGNPLAVSRAGARGLMQLMPQTAAELGVRDPFDPSQNIMGGTRYLRRLLDRYQGDRKLALAAYNWGMGNVEKRLEVMPRETRDYILNVENLYQIYSKA